MSDYLILAILLFAYMATWFVASVFRKRNDVADVAWGLGFVLMAWASFYLSESSHRALLVNALVTFWGLRLSVHIYLRSRNRPEDFRYHQWRLEWKHFYVRSFFQVFMLQGVFLYVTVFPVVFINLSASPKLSLLDATGVLVWIVGFLFESVGDYQLKKFKFDQGNRGRIMTTGLWRYTRHPNYFGEAVQWWGIFIIALSAPNGWITVIGPLTITWLLRYVSGVPMLERKYRGNPEFEAYKKRTSAFFPLPQKSR